MEILLTVGNSSLLLFCKTIYCEVDIVKLYTRGCRVGEGGGGDDYYGVCYPFSRLVGSAHSAIIKRSEAGGEWERERKSHMIIIWIYMVNATDRGWKMRGWLYLQPTKYIAYISILFL